MSEDVQETQLNKTLRVLTKATIHLIKAIKENSLAFDRQHNLYLELIPILSKTNQALLKREDVDTAMVEFTDKINVMYGDARNAQNDSSKMIGAEIDILKGIKTLMELNNDKSDELLKWLKEHNNI